MRRQELLTNIAKHHGYDAQTRQLTEEVGELLQAINKFWRYDLNKGKTPLECAKCRNQHGLIEEIADVKNVLDQLCILLDCVGMVDIMSMQKLEREWGRICGTTWDKR